MESVNLFPVVFEESKKLYKLQKESGENVKQLKKRKKNKKRTRGEKEFYDMRNEIAETLRDKYEISPDEVSRLKKTLTAKKRNCSEAWTQIDKLITFGGEGAKKRYGNTLAKLNKDKYRYEMMSFIIDLL